MKKKKKIFIWLKQYNIQLYKWHKIKQTSRARLPENPEVNHAGHLNINFLFIMKLQLQLYLKTHKESNWTNWFNSRSTWKSPESWTKALEGERQYESSTKCGIEIELIM